MLPYGLIVFKKMNSLHLKRGLLWIKELTFTLTKFWIKNPGETPAILGFILEKAIASPRFLSKNIMVEKHSQKFGDMLTKTTALYKKYGLSFNPRDSRSYEKLKTILQNKSQLLYFLVRKIKPNTVVETGVAAGESTGYILKALHDNKKGKLYSIDLPFQWYIYGNHKLHLDSLPSGKMPGYLIPENLKKNWQLILGNTYEKLPELMKTLKRISIFLHDSEHSDKAMMFEYKQAWPNISSGGLLLSDDISYTKAFEKFAKKQKKKYISFLDLGVISK